MALLISNIRVGLEEDREDCIQKAILAAGLDASQIRRSWIAKRSLDARKQDRISFLYTVGLEAEGEDRVKPGPDVSLFQPQPLVLTPGTAPLEAPPVIAGFGPGGMFCGLVLARMGYRPIILERGQEMDKRVGAVEAFLGGGPLLDHSNIQFGEGGAGTFSDGKLTTRTHDPRCRYVLEQLAAFGAPEEILWEAKPHIGTDLLRQVVQNLRHEIIRLGGQVRFETPLEAIRLRGGTLCGVTAGGTQLPAQVLVLAVGHSARDTFDMVYGLGLPMEAKPFSVGARIEHLQETIDRWLYGSHAGHPALPRGEYQLSHRDARGRAVYTFCMCPGGVVVPAASEEGAVVTNGMSRHLRDGRNANSALVVSVDGRDFGSGPLDGVAFQREIERRAYAAAGGGYRAPAQTVGRFLAGKPGGGFGAVQPSYALGVVPGDLDALLPPAVAGRMKEGLRLFGRRLPGFDAADAVLTGPETRTSSPVRILRDDSLQSPGARGVYPCGEGAGYAGGIMSAAVDGIRLAQRIVETYKSID